MNNLWWHSLKPHDCENARTQVTCHTCHYALNIFHWGVWLNPYWSLHSLVVSKCATWWTCHVCTKPTWKPFNMCCSLHPWFIPCFLVFKKKLQVMFTPLDISCVHCRLWIGLPPPNPTPPLVVFYIVEYHMNFFVLSNRNDNMAWNVIIDVLIILTKVSLLFHWGLLYCLQKANSYTTIK